MTDDELLGYALIHCQTDLALFSKEHVRRLFELAGRSVPDHIESRAFWSCGPELVEHLVKEARNNV